MLLLRMTGERWTDCKLCRNPQLYEKTGVSPVDLKPEGLMTGDVHFDNQGDISFAESSVNRCTALIDMKGKVQLMGEVVLGRIKEDYPNVEKLCGIKLRGGSWVVGECPFQTKNEKLENTGKTE